MPGTTRLPDPDGAPQDRTPANRVTAESRLPALKYRDGLACWRRHDFEYLRPGKGSHEFWIDRRTGKVTMVACHPDDIPRGTLRAIITQAGLSPEEFLR
jgi:predicted RNA binding protein YcfA (HicA-like mRNA interferase family)